MPLTVGLQLPFGVQPVNPYPVDSWSGPYTGLTETAAKSEANSSITPAIRFQSMEVRLIYSGRAFKYWYRDGTGDSQLVKFDGDYLNYSGVGISGRIAKFINENTISNTSAPIFESGTSIGFGVTNPKESVDFSGNTLVRGQIIEGVSFQSVGSAGGTGLYLNLDNGNVHVVNLTGNITGVMFNNPSESYCTAFTLQINQSGTGSNTLSWAGPTIKWAGGSSQAPAITATAGRTDTFGFITTDGGSSYFGFIVAQNSYV